MEKQEQSEADCGHDQTGIARQTANRFQREFDTLLLWLIAAGLFVTILYGGSAQYCPAPSAAGGRALTAAAQCGPDANFVGMLLALFVALGALAIGTFVGFLFGLPRSLTSSEFRAARQQAAANSTSNPGGTGTTSPAAADGAGAGAAATPGSGSDVNTNLEKISDWLTTIIVGVGLTKLQEIPGSIDSFGERVAPYFGHGGKIFAIGGGLFFLIAGFFLSYVGTRVRLSLIFILSQWTNRGVADGVVTQQVIDTATNAPAIAPAEPAGTAGNLVPDARAVQEGEDLKQADQLLLSKSLSDLKSPAEIVAWANAKARSGDFGSALTAYKDLWGKVPFTEKMQTDYATILAANGDAAGANNVLSALATSGLSADAEREARQRVAAAAQTGQSTALRNRLQQGLYRPAERGFDDSILAGEELLSRPEHDGDAMAHLWLASAYGQKHGDLKLQAGEPPTAAQTRELHQYRDKALAQARRALELEPSLKPMLQGLYDRRFRVGDDDDLDSIAPDPDFDTLLEIPPRTTP